ncbi:MAG: DUF4390 domain-containing protein [Nitrospirota bacterium]
MLITSCLVFLQSLAEATEIKGPDIKIRNGAIYATAALSPNEKIIQDMKNGIAKEFRFYIDIFRIWEFWPDEFIVGKLLVRTLKCDPVKTEFVATSNDGDILIEKRFKSFESMADWALTIEDLRVTKTQELETGAYYVRVTVESKIRDLPPVIGYFIIFLPEYEFRIRKNSAVFYIEPEK